MGKTYRKNKKYFDDDYGWDSDYKSVEGKNKSQKKKARQLRENRRISNQRKYGEIIYDEDDNM